MKQVPTKDSCDFIQAGDDLMTIAQAEFILKKSYTAIYESIRQGALTSYVIRHKTFVVKDEIESAVKKFPRLAPRQDGYYPSVFRSRKTEKKRQAPVLALHPRFTYNITVV